MPDLIRVPDLSHDEQNHLDDLMVQWRAKRPRNNIRSAFYDMKNSERPLMSREMPASIKRRKFVLGWSAMAVDKLNRRCNVEDFYDANGNDLASLGLDEYVRENRLLAEISQAGVASLMHAVSWLVTIQGDVQSGEPAVITLGCEATTSTGNWDRRRRSMKDFMSIIEQDDDGEPTEINLYLPNLNLILTKRGAAWSVERRTHSYGVPVDPMRYKPRLNRPFGSSRITRTAMSLHMQAVAATIRADVNGEAYSLPRFALLGATEAAFQNADGSPKATWEAAWEAIWAIGDDEDLIESGNSLARADIKQFHGQSPEPQNASLRMLAQLFSGETGIPIGELGITGDSNPTSAEALQTSRDDLITEAGRTIDDWRSDVSSAVERALAMRNKTLPKNLAVQSQWRKPVHASSAQAADAGSKILDKAPWLADTEVGLELLGLTKDQIARATAERRRGQARSLLDRVKARADGSASASE